MNGLKSSQALSCVTDSVGLNFIASTQYKDGDTLDATAFVHSSCVNRF